MQIKTYGCYNLICSRAARVEKCRIFFFMLRNSISQLPLLMTGLQRNTFWPIHILLYVNKYLPIIVRLLIMYRHHQGEKNE